MSSLDVILAGYSAGINDEDKLNDPLFTKGYEIATHDKPIFKRTPPAVGTRRPDADVIAGPEYKKVLTRPRTIPEEIEYQNRNDDLLKIEGTQGELFSEEKKPSTNPRAQSAREKRNRQKGDAGEVRENERRGGEQLKPEEIWPNYPNMLKINPDAIKGILQLIPILTGIDLQMAGGPLLPGEKGPTPGGLGNMNKDALERWIKENNMSGPAADKIRTKWGGLGPSLPIDLADAKALTETLEPHQNQRSGSLRGMSDEERINLLRLGVAAHNKA